MTEPFRMPVGLPCWVDISVPTSQQRRELMTFLTTVFGWRWEEGGPETGFYSMGFLRDAHVIAIGEQEHGQGVWVTYFHIDDIESSIANATSAGAVLVFGPMQVMQAGSIALLMDPTGAMHGLWQPELFGGFDVVYQPGAPGWFDLSTADVDAALDYYRALLNVDVQRSATDGSELNVLVKGEQWFASISALADNSRPQWTPIYIVESLADTRARARGAGAEILVEEMPVPGSSLCVFREPVMGMAVSVMAAGQQP